MTTVPIPIWNSMGVLPPIDLYNPTSPERSPYSVSLLDVVMRFATSPERMKILNGFLDFRTLLHSLGIKTGFQWLDGSFMENVEILKQRAPEDIDVVTLSYQGSFVPSANNLALLDHVYIKTNYLVDNYFVELDLIQPEALVEQSAYWYSMWSHRRNEAWKGYLQVDLAPTEDQLAKLWLIQSMVQEDRI